MLDEERWDKLVMRLSGNLPPDGSFNRIVTAYSECHRYYHTISHIMHCLAEFDAVKRSSESPAEVEFAIWLHDVVYDTHASDNEEKSAQIAEEILSDSGCPKMTVKKIQDLILITKHIQPPQTLDAHLIMDIDLTILGQPPEIFDVYERNIRAEYFWVPTKEYKTGRSKVIQRFLDKSTIYYTNRFETLYGNQAKENLTRALSALAH